MKTYTGSFNTSVELRSIARKGAMKVIARSNDCTYQSDAKPTPIKFDENSGSPLVVVMTSHGNDGRSWVAAATPSAQARLAQLNLRWGNQL